MLKYFLILILVFLLNFFASAQSVKEFKNVKDHQNKFSLSLKYYISESEHNDLIKDLNELLGNSVQKNVWVSNTEENETWQVKIQGNYLYVKGFDNTSEGNTKRYLQKLADHLEKYSD